MFEVFFKYSPVVFSEGEISFNYLPSWLMMFAVALAFALSLWIFYRKTTLEISNLFKTTLIVLKFAALAILLFLLLEPFVTVATIVPRKSSLIVLVDDSKSMSIRDVGNGKKRSDYAQTLLGNVKKSGLLHNLAQNFKLQTYKFSSRVEHLAQTTDLLANGNSTDLANSLNFAAKRARQGAVAGIIVLTDGVNNSASDPLAAASLMKNNKLPVFLVGIGSADSKDIELTKVTANQSVFENSVVEIAALLKSTGIGKKTVELELRQDGNIIKNRTISLKGAATRITMNFSPQKKGFGHYSLHAITNEKETIYNNNSSSFLIDNRNKKARVLYIEGYPRAEFKFLRRALDGDANIQLVSLLRTGEDKFYRQGIDDRDELKDGYPKTREELFKYDAIIYGSIERDFFTESQLQNTFEFVAERGGGFLMIGGSNAFGQGKYAGSAIEKLLPVELLGNNDLSSYPASTFHDKYRLLPTPEGYRNPMMQLSRESGKNRPAWDSLPELEGYNVLGGAKPGATILAIHPLSEPDNPRIIIAQQRFGRGRSMIFANSSSWLWQMGLPHADMTHERFWRQVMRWLALSSPDPIETNPEKETYVPGERVTLNTEVRNSTFLPVRDAKVTALIKTPSGATLELKYKWSSAGKLSYECTFAPDEVGVYLVEVTAKTRNNRFLGRSETAFLVEESKAEFTRAHLQAPFLKRIAEVSGGKYYFQDEAQNLPTEIAVMKSSYSKLVDNDLWDMPFWFGLVIVILSIEWFVRRHHGLS